MADIKISGLDALRLNLSSIPQNLVRNALRTGIRRGSNIIRDAAKQNFGNGEGPESVTGILRDSIRTVERRGTSTFVHYNIVAGNLTDEQQKRLGRFAAFYALWVEKGHINRKAGSALRGSKQFVKYQREISSSNTPPHPFMRPALDEKAQAAVDAVADELRARLGDLA